MPSNAYLELNAALSGRYAILRELGAGGMATVYLAQDLRHDRKVALKVLRPELSAILGAERFLAEIKTTANLQHPHILSLFDSGEADGTVFYVMPYVEGESLRDRIKREQQLPIDDALRIAREVLDALEYAHKQGIVHRDIKPENILLHGGHAMVADFGIALAASKVDGGTRMTETGMSLGTPHYMSPEQAMGERVITGKADVYALGCVLYEMLTGEPPFTGTSAQAVFARVLTDEPRSLTLQRKTVPQNVAAAVGKALEKLPADRFENARAFAEALREPHFTHGMPAVGSPARVPAQLSLPVMVVASGLAALGLALAAWGWQQGLTAAPGPVVPLTLELPNARPDLARFAVSHDGSRFAFATDEGLVVRDSGSREFRLLPGTENGESPSFSPDGSWLVYGDHGHLRKVPVAGGAMIPVVPGDTLLSGRVRWGADGTIVFERANSLYLVSPSGAVRALRGVDRGESPRLMPDGSGVLFLDTRVGSKLKYYDFAADTAVTILEESAEAIYLPTGHLLYAAPTGGLFAIRYDAKRRAVSGSPIPVVSDIQPNGGASPFDVTRNGTLVYRSGVEPEYRVVVREPSGKIDTLPLAPRIIAYVRASPDGRTLALTIGSARGTNRHTALYDVSLGRLTRFTQEGGGHAPVWSPDGRRMAFTADVAGGDAEDVFVQPVDRSTPPVRLFSMPSDQHGSAWPSDSLLVFSSASGPGFLGSVAVGGTPAAIHVANPLTPGAKPRAYVMAEWGQTDPAVSPNGKWAAFTSLESGTPEILVRPFPAADAGGIVKVSSGGGQRARWSADGQTIYYQSLDGSTIRAARLTFGATVRVGASEVIMTVPGFGNGWDVDRAGRIYVTQAVRGEQARIVVMQGWLDEFRRMSRNR